MKQDELNQILELHKKWLQDESEGERADLRDALLIRANLRGAFLIRAKLSDANLRASNLSDANLSDANLRGTDLNGANLRCADIRGADLRNADLRNADLTYADLRDADLRGADLRYANTLLLQGMTVIECQLNTSAQNRRISYWKDLDIVTAGYYQGTWAEFKERVKRVYGDNPVMKRKHDRVIAFIEAEAEEEEE